MQKQILLILVVALTLTSCSSKLVKLTNSNLTIVNRDISSINPPTNTVTLNNKMGDGMAIVDNVDFETGTIAIDLKGENTPGRSFVGIAFNIQNDSTYEAIYFRPFNFQAKEKIRRDHSVQYISHPKNSWRYLRTNFEGQYEAAYDRQPAPDAWFAVKIKIEGDRVSVYDTETEQELLSVKRIEGTKSKKIGLWMGNNSKGAFRNLRIMK